MGTTVYQNPPSGDHLDDLKVKILSSSLISISSQSPTPTNKKVACAANTNDDHPLMFLSNIDQVLNFDVQTIHFFEPHPDLSPELSFDKIRAALHELLEPYPFLAGRIGTNPDNGRLEFICNDAGLGFVVASSDLTLEEIGDLVFPNPAFAQLVTLRLDDYALAANVGHPLCIVQVTSFKCGGFAMGVQTNHATFDGSSFKAFLENLAALAAGKPLAIRPCHDRSLLAARSPPRVTFPHPELLKMNTAMGQEKPQEDPEQPNPNPNPNTNSTTNTTTYTSENVFNAATDELAFKIFRLSAEDINGLKSKAKMGLGPNSDYKAKITGFNVVSAHVWRSKALSSFKYDPERESTLLFAVDIRPRLSPPLPAEFAGNAVLTAYATARCGEIETAEFVRLVEIITEGSARMTDEYARSAVDWGEINKGFPYGEFLISSWWKLGLDRVQYPWGRPKYSCPLVHRRKDIVLLFPDCNANADTGEGEAVNVLVALPFEEMLKFEKLFYEL